MQMTESEHRAKVIAEAKTWLRTPFRHAARLKGVGADCETFICEVFSAAGVFSAQGIPYVPAQWFLNTKEELYLNYLSKYAAEYVVGRWSSVVGRGPKTNDQRPLPGDIICVKHRWVHSHGAIVIAWPQVIHCFPPCVMESNAHYNPVFAHRELKFFDPWGNKNA
jgi:cell wall-associated NlpC family hydrolase